MLKFLAGKSHHHWDIQPIHPYFYVLTVPGSMSSDNSSSSSGDKPSNKFSMEAEAIRLSARASQDFIQVFSLRFTSSSLPTRIRYFIKTK